MRAAIVPRFGAPDVIAICEMRDPIPGPGDVSIDVTHAAVGLVDVVIRQGLYKDRAGLPQPPYVPGSRVAGSVRELGDGVEGFAVGEPVVTVTGTGAEGGYASISVVDARFVVSSGVDPELAVATVPNAATAYLALTNTRRAPPTGPDRCSCTAGSAGWRPRSRGRWQPRGLDRSRHRARAQSPDRFGFGTALRPADC
jgi:NADPH:quinone reductase